MRKFPCSSNIHATKHEWRQVKDIHISFLFTRLTKSYMFCCTNEVYLLTLSLTCFLYNLIILFCFVFLLKAKMIMALDCSTDIHEVGHHSIDHLSEEIKMACASVPVYGFDQTGCPSSSVMPMTSVAGNPWTCVSLFTLFVCFFQIKSVHFTFNLYSNIQ